MPDGASFPTAHHQRAADTLWRRLADRLVLAGSDCSKSPVVINDTGALVWDLLERPQTADNLVDQLATRRVGDVTVIRRDVLELLEQLHTHGFVVSP